MAKPARLKKKDVLYSVENPCFYSAKALHDEGNYVETVGAAACSKELRSGSSGADIIYVAGKNTTDPLNHLKAMGFVRLLTETLDTCGNLTIAGFSAGISVWHECFDADCNILSGVTDRTVFPYLDYFPVIFNLHGQGEMKAGFLS
ncbi:MAG: Type 1 glutamine amidotransferase-like domain-containing protein, partial [Bacilli bacterium]